MLIIGASGLIGRALAKSFASKFDLIGTYYNHNYKPDYVKLRRLDLNNFAEIEDCLDDIHPAVVVHAAGLTDILFCEENNQHAENVNYRATAQLAAFCAQRAIRLIYLSTDMVFDGSQGNYKEDDTPAPINQYGKSKFAAEEAIKSISANSVIARLNLIYGHAEALKKTFSDRILIANWAQRSYGVFAGQIRSPLSIENAVRAIKLLADSEQTGIYHLGGAEQIDRWDFALKIAAYLKLDPSIIEKADIPHNLKNIYPLNTSYDISKAQNDLKTDFLSVEDGLKLEYGKFLE